MSGETPHVLTLGACQECCLVLADPDEAWCGNDTCYPSWSIECPGTDVGGCLTWWECRVCPDARQHEAVDEMTGMAHGVEHQWMQGVWMTPGTQCWPQVSDHSCDEVQRLVEDGLPQGRHLIHVDSDEEYPIFLPIGDKGESA